MHLGKFHAAISLLKNDYQIRQINSRMIGIIQQLDALAANPGNTEVAQKFRQQIDNLNTTLSRSTLNKPYPTLAMLLDDIDAQKYTGDQLFQKIEAIISENSMTPQLAASELRELLNKVEKFFKEVIAIDEAFTELHVEYEVLEAGEGEIGISIPQGNRDRLLSDLAKVAKTWDKALRPFVELSDPEHNPIVVRTISSSDWQIYLASVPAVYLTLSSAISKINDLLQKLIETRKLIDQLLEKGVSTASTANIVAETDRMLENGTRALAEKIVDESGIEDTGRANELKTEVTSSLKFIAREMANNVKVEIRYFPPIIPEKESPDTEEDPATIAKITSLTEISAQIKRNMDLIRLDSEAKELLNLPAPDEED